MRPVPLGMLSHSLRARSGQRGTDARWSAVHRLNPSAARDHVALKGASSVPSRKGDPGCCGYVNGSRGSHADGGGTGSCNSQVTVIGFSPVQVSKRGRPQ